MIRSRYTLKPAPGFTFSEPSMALQSEKRDTMIEAYLRKYRATGFLGDPNRKAVATFGDFTGVEDYQTLRNKMAVVEQHFEGLPSNIRRFFGDDPANYVHFVTDPSNMQKAIEMGLLSQGENDAQTQDQNAQAKPVQSPVTQTAESVKPEGAA